MFILLARVAAKRGLEVDFVELSQRLMYEPSRADSGCLSYDLFRDTDPAGGFLWVEQWESQEAIDAHLKTPHFDRYIAEVEPLLASPPEIKIFEVATTAS